jgi:hypothetical protein
MNDLSWACSVIAAMRAAQCQVDRKERCNEWRENDESFLRGASPSRFTNQSCRGLNCRDLSVGHVNRTQRALCQLVVVRDQDNRRSLIVDGLK